MKNNLIIPKPCSEDWNKMSIVEKGKFCGSCNKVVIDFTKMSTNEISVFFESNEIGKTCGHFKNTQLKNNNEIKSYKNRPLKYLALLGIGVLTILNSCRNKVTGEPQIKDESKEKELTGALLPSKKEMERLKDSINKDSIFKIENQKK
jgi:hypothetical protein